MTPFVSIPSDKMTSILRDQERNQGEKREEGIEGSGWAVVVEVVSQHDVPLTGAAEALA